MFQKTKATLASCTREVAAKFAAMPAFSGERKLRQHHVALLHNLVGKGRFVSPTWAVVVDSATGTTYRANGQHSSTMLAALSAEEFAEAFPNGLNVTIEEWTTDDLKGDAYGLFIIFDNPIMSRSNYDVMGFHTSQFPELVGIDEKFAVSLANGMAFYERSVENGVVLIPRERGSYLSYEDRRVFVQWAVTHEKARHGWLFTKPGVTAEMFANWLKNRPLAEEFWGLVLTESHPDSDHETRDLSRILKDFAGRPKIKQDRFRREAAKRWKVFQRTHPFETTETMEVPATV
jgi:hypothetical protein